MKKNKPPRGKVPKRLAALDKQNELRALLLGDQEPGFQDMGRYGTSVMTGMPVLDINLDKFWKTDLDEFKRRFRD